MVEQPVEKIVYIERPAPEHPTGWHPEPLLNPTLELSDVQHFLMKSPSDYPHNLTILEGTKRSEAVRLIEVPVEVELEKRVFVEVPVEIDSEIFKAESHNQHLHGEAEEVMRTTRVVEKIVEVPLIVEKEVQTIVEKIVEVPV